jgi:hypothetical protein
VAENPSKKTFETVDNELPSASFDLGQSAAIDMSKRLQPVQQSKLGAPTPQLRILNSQAAESGVRTKKTSTAFQEAEDEISTFFKNRHIANHGLRGMGFFSKLAIIHFGTTLMVLLSWNYSEVVRTSVQKYGREFAGVNVASVIPTWSGKAKLFKRDRTGEAVAVSVSVSGSATPTGFGKASLAPPLDKMYSNVQWGHWPVVEDFIKNKCPKWVVDYPCSVRAWYLASRGMKGMIRPVQSLDLKSPQIPPNAASAQRIQAMFLFAKATSATGLAAQNFFNEAMSILGKDSGMKVMLFDTRFQSSLQSGRQDEVSKMIAMIPSLDAPPNMIAKWSLLEKSTRLLVKYPTYTAESGAIAQKTLGAIVDNASGAIYQDALGMLRIQKNLLRLGLGKAVVKIFDKFEGFQGINGAGRSAAGLDPDIHLDYDNSYVRAALIDKNKNGALARLSNMRDRKQTDSISRHLQASLYLESQLSTDWPRAVLEFNLAIAGHDSWQSEAGYLLALTKVGNWKEASKVAVKLQRLSNPLNADRVAIVISEYKMAIAKGSGGLAASRYAEVAGVLGAIFSKNPTWTKLASLYAVALTGANKREAAREILLKNDVILSKTSYFTSLEYLQSPFGPLALMD